MFYVNRPDLFIAIPVEEQKFEVEVEVGFDDCAYLTFVNRKSRTCIHLTSQQITDMIDSLKEIQSRLGKGGGL